jgi:hypothetical protein
LAQQLSRTEEVRLAYEFFDGTGAHPLGERRLPEGVGSSFFIE